MAKSIKSKWRRKMRNVKREKYAKKDLERLKKMIESADSKQDQEMKELFTASKPSSSKTADESVEKMEVEGKKRDPKTLRDENGHYPVWMNSRQIKKHKKRLQDKAKRKNKKK